MTVDPMHDILEGLWQYDIGKILYQLIVSDRLFTCENLNMRIRYFNFGPDKGRNKPRPIALI